MNVAPPEHQHPYREAMCPKCESAHWLKEHQDAGRERLTPQKVHERLKKIENVNKRVETHDNTVHSKSGVALENTISWLKNHNEEKKKSVGFIESILHWFKDEPENKGPQLPLTWADQKMNVPWSERSYAVLNAPFLVDMMHARRIILSGALLDVSPDIAADFKAWIDEFFEQLSLCHRLKDCLLEEKARITNKAIRVVTQYDNLQKLYEKSLDLKVSTTKFADTLIEFINEVEATLRDEAAAVNEINPIVMTSLTENEAFSTLFSTMTIEEPAGVYVAKLVAWMKNALNRSDFNAFMSLFDSDVRECIAGEWMQVYATHLQRLEPFSIEFYCTAIYSRSRAEVAAHVTNPTKP